MSTLKSSKISLYACVVLSNNSNNLHMPHFIINYCTVTGKYRISIMNYYWHQINPIYCETYTCLLNWYIIIFRITGVIHDMKHEDYARTLLPNIPVTRMVLMNHDPVAGMTCPAGVYHEPISHLVTTNGKLPAFRTRKMDRVFLSNRDPVMISSKGIPGQEYKIWVLLCKLKKETPGCNFTENNTYTRYVSCPKYELKTVPAFWTKFITLNNGEKVLADEIMKTADDHVLVCAEEYEIIYRDSLESKLTIVVSTCYSVSLLCLLTTFVIHLRYHPLRTLPGLMLMNLTVALFLAQLIYLPNSHGLFLGEPIFCQVMATAQHYFWLASFAWMACMSLDIFNCLSASCITVNTYTAGKYYKYVLAGWLAPLPIPLVSNVLTITNPGGISYDYTLCWLAGPRAVLYLFALPVLSIVTVNIILLIGSVYRLYSLLQNAAYIGRKEDNKQRLTKCIKLSSWMGISWLFGIVPNLVDVDALWYVFAIANAFQGVHIFFAFGITGRARELMRRDTYQHTTASAAAHTSVRSISASVNVDWTVSL